MPRTTNPRKALAGGIAGTALLLALGVAAVAQVTDSGPASPAASAARASSEELATPAAPGPQAAPPETAPPTTVAAPAPAAPTTAAPAAKTAAPSTTATTRKAPSTTVAPAPAVPTTTPTTVPRVRSGERVAYTAGGVQSAVAAITQRIPLFKPNDAQLRAFADAVCGQFDQGQTLAQVQATIRQAVTQIQGQSLSDADAAFMVQTVTALRCPGYLP